MEKQKAVKKIQKKDRWPVTAFFVTFGLALVFSAFSETTLIGVPVFVAVLILLFIIVIGIAADIIGVSVTCEDVTAYTAMASKKIRGAKQAIQLIQNADRVSNVCNDVIGDICGIVSGAMGIALVSRLVTENADSKQMIFNIVLSALISAVTVGGKAIGKKIALKHSHDIVFFVARVAAIFSKNNTLR